MIILWAGFPVDAFPKAELIGIDISSNMIQKAKKSLRSFDNRVQLLEQAYATGSQQIDSKVDVILLSYTLTMINPHWENFILQAKKDLRPGGIIAIVDFHDSALPFFKSHMSGHHVRMDSHLLPFLKKHFCSEYQAVRPAYLGVWQYFMFIGSHMDI